jgi:hypothetical protein
MSYYLYNFEEDIDYDKIIIGDKIKLENNKFIYYIYYLDKTPKDFYIKLPSIKLIYSYKNNKFNQIKIPLYPIYDKIEKLIKFFKKLKNKIKEVIITEKTYSDCIYKKDNLKLLKINITDNFKINYKNDKIDIKELKTMGEIYGILNISYIWENENSYGLSLNAIKIIYIPKIENNDFDFIDIFNDTPFMNIQKKSTMILNSQLDDNKILKTDIKRQSLLISPNLLLEMKNKLNKIDNDIN